MGSFEIGSGVKIHPSAVVSKLVRIGNNVTIGANAVVEDYSDIGDGSVIGPNAVVGAEGLMSLWDEDGNPVLVPHAGSVAIGENVLVLAGTVIAKSMFMTPTRIGDRCQIGILTNIGHGAQIGQGSVVSGNCIIAGRVTVGSGAWIGASCSIGQGLSVGAKAQVKMGSVVVQNVGDGEIVSGNFAVPHSMNVRAFLKAKTR
jgi:UDP-3-O-[3-hydroxymyristoyl] glucosamine N-acyltransferase